MSAFPSLPLFTDAFIADTGHLSAQETGAYLMLMMVAWRSPECRLPDNDDKLARWARVDRRTWLRIKSTVLEFWTLDDGFWTQKRLSKEREFVSKRAEVARENGQQGGRPKSLKDKETANPAGSPRATQQKAPNPNPNPIDHSGDKPLRDPHAQDFPSNAFELWYDGWPNKVGKHAAEKAFDRVRRSGKVRYATLIEGRDRYKATKPLTREWCNPATWLNQGRWADAPATTAQPRASPFQRGSGNAMHDLLREEFGGSDERSSAPQYGKPKLIAGACH